MKFSELASIIAKVEGNTSEVKIGDIREILSLLVKMDRAFRKGTLDFSPLVVLATISLEKETKLKKAKKAKKGK
jgi:hypothetical protein